MHPLHPLFNLSFYLLLILHAHAQSPTTAPIFLLNTDPQSLLLSIISVPNPSTTLLRIACPSNYGNCGVPASQGLAVEHISNSIWRASVTVADDGDGDFSLTWGCTLSSDTAAPSVDLAGKVAGEAVVNVAVCTTSVGGAAANDPGSGMTTVIGDDLRSAVVNPIIVAGAEKLGSPASDAASMPSATATSTMASVSPTSISSSKPSAGSTTTSTGSSTKPVSTTGKLYKATTNSSAPEVFYRSVGGTGGFIALLSALLGSLCVFAWL